MMNAMGTEESITSEASNWKVSGSFVTSNSRSSGDEKENEGSSESGIDETEFQTLREEAVKQFARQSDESTSFSLDDLFDSLSTKNITRTSLLSRVELDPASNRLQLQEDRSNIRTKYGYDLDKKGHLYPEEALYLLELGKIEIFCNNISLSLQRARSLLLLAERKNDMDKLIQCTDEGYLVYKYLSRMGYCLYPYVPDPNNLNEKSANSSSNESEDMEDGDDDEEDEMEDELSEIIIEAQTGEESRTTDTEDIIELEPQSYGECQNRGLKRKCPSIVDEVDDVSEMSDEDMAEEGGNFCSGHQEYFSTTEPGGYTVDEADSDIEIVDEVIFSHGGVEIQEIGHSAGYLEDCNMDVPIEPTPSTSKGPQLPQVVVDLVSSDDEGEENLRVFENTIWSSFVPNAKLVFGMPPSSLTPGSIPDHDAIYEFDLKDKSDISDLELEFLVDEVSLNDDAYDTSHYLNLSATKSWKEWRQNIFREARDVMNESLLASSEYINGEAAADKLFLWKEKHALQRSALSTLNIIYEMYGPAMHGFSRLKAKEEKPGYYVLVTRQDDQIPDFGFLESSIDGVPILIAVVCDSGNDVVLMTGDRSPLDSLF